MSTPTATVLVEPRRTTGQIDDRVYGQFVENMGRAINALRASRVPCQPHTTPDGIVRETTFHPLAVARRCAENTGLDVVVLTEAGIEFPGAPGGSLSALDAAATCDLASGRLHLSLVNRLPDAELLVELEAIAGPAQRITLWADEPDAVNSPEDPDRVVPVEDQIELDGALTLPPHSHVTLVFT